LQALYSDIVVRINRVSNLESMEKSLPAISAIELKYKESLTSSIECKPVGSLPNKPSR